MRACSASLSASKIANGIDMQQRRCYRGDISGSARTGASLMLWRQNDEKAGRRKATLVSGQSGGRGKEGAGNSGKSAATTTSLIACRQRGGGDDVYFIASRAISLSQRHRLSSHATGKYVAVGEQALDVFSPLYMVANGILNLISYSTQWYVASILINVMKAEETV